MCPIGRGGATANKGMLRLNYLVSFPGLPRFCFLFLFFGLRSVLYTEAEKRKKEAKAGKTYRVTWDVRWTWVGGGAVPDYKYVCNKLESEFLTFQAEYSRDLVIIWGLA